MDGKQGAQLAKESQVVRQLNEAHGAIDRLLGSIGQLEDELTSVCRNEPEPEPERPENPAPIEPLVSRAGNIRSIAIDIDECTARINRLLETIEV